MWNTWSRRTKATAFVTKKTNSISTKRWKSSSTNIYIPRRQPPRGQPVRDRTRESADFTSAIGISADEACTEPYAKIESFLRFHQWRRLVFRYSRVDATAQFAVTYAVKEINQQTNSKPNKEADPRLQRQA